MGWEHCKNSKGQKWSTQLTFYLSKDFAWGIRSSTKYIRVYMTKKLKIILILEFMKLQKNGKQKKIGFLGIKLIWKMSSRQL